MQRAESELLARDQPAAMAPRRRMLYDMNSSDIGFKHATNTSQPSGSKGKSPVLSGGKRIDISYKPEDGVEYPLSTST